MTIEIKFLIIIFSCIMLCEYFISSLTLYKASKILKFKKGWLSWIPFINKYILLKLGNKSTSYFRINFYCLFFQTSYLIYENIYIKIFLLVVIFLFIIYSMFLTIQCFKNISEIFRLNFKIFLVGYFIKPILILAYYNLYRKLRVSC